MNLYRRDDLRTWFEEVGVLYVGVVALVVVGFLTVWVLDSVTW